MRSLLILGAMVAAAAGGGLALRSGASAQPANAWEIGPVIRGRNHSVGMPPAPAPAARGGWSFDFPYPNERAGHVHYLTTRTGSLLGRSRIVMRYRIDAAPGAVLTPRESPGSPATLTLYFQRRGDNWSGRRHYEHYRWYASHPNRVPLSAGEHEVSLTLEARNWKSLGAATGDRTQAEFRDALAEADRVGFVLGGGGSAGHGVYATGPARFTLISFRII
jgi:hypothetical protein